MQNNDEIVMEGGQICIPIQKQSSSTTKDIRISIRFKRSIIQRYRNDDRRWRKPSTSTNLNNTK